MRAAERDAFDAGVSQETLMDRAGIAIAREVHRHANGGSILVLAGPGNNGGDAFVAAGYLRDWGHDVLVATVSSAKPGTACAKMRSRWAGPVVDIANAPARPIVVDGVFGTGLSRPLAEDVAERLATLSTGAFVIAIDVPSGCDADAVHEFGGTMSANVTVALGALKPIHVAPFGGGCGTIRVADIGVAVPRGIRSIRRSAVHPPARHAHKYSRGLVSVLSGRMPGAARLSARAALCGGAGYVILAGDPTGGGPDALVHRTLDSVDALSAMVDDPRVAALLVGPGLGRDADAIRLLDAAIAAPRTLILDGDALSVLGTEGPPRLRARSAATILTPHEGEFGRMFPALSGNKIDRTIAAARLADATIVHKGPTTIVAQPDGDTVVATGGTSWLSTAGTGDVLAGVVAARIAATNIATGSVEAVWLHARAAQLAGPAFIADDLVDHLGAAIAECR